MQLGEAIEQQLARQNISINECSRLCAQLKGTTQADSVRKTINRISKQEVVPRLGTILLLLSALDGRLCIAWDGKEKKIYISDSVMFSKAIAKRMQERRVTLQDLCRDYVRLCQNKGDVTASLKRRSKVIKVAISEQGNPTAQTMTAILNCLDGQLCIEWNSSVAVPIG